MNIRIIPSVASANPLYIGAEIDRLGEYPYLHLDIEDTSFVPNITFGMKTIRAIADKSKARLDAHLMVTHPDNWIAPLYDCGVKSVCVQVEALRFPMCTLNAIRRAGMEAGLAFTMKSDIEQLHAYRDAISYVLILATEPDGQETCNTFAFAKLRRARAILPPETSIWMDGGLDRIRSEAAVKCGADTLIMGRYVWKAGNPAAAIEELLQSLNNAYTIL